MTRLCNYCVIYHAEYLVDYTLTGKTSSCQCKETGCTHGVPKLQEVQLA